MIFLTEFDELLNCIDVIPRKFVVQNQVSDAIVGEVSRNAFRKVLKKDASSFSVTQGLKLKMRVYS